MRYCKKCIEPDTRPGAEFNDEGICLPCQYKTQVVEADWNNRKLELSEVCGWARQYNQSGYDCIIPVSGGKDSTRQALYMRDEMGMKPLLVSLAYPPEQQTERGARNMANLINLGFDAHYISLSPQTWKKLVRFSFYEFGNVFKSSELALFASAPKVALAFGVKLLVYGENAGLQWGGTVHSRNGDAIKIKYSNTLQGGDVSPYLGAGFDREKMYWYDYPSDDELIQSGTKIIYLGYYIPDFDDRTNAKISIDNGLEVRKGFDADPENTGSVTEFDALDDDFVMVNQMLKYIRFGFGKATQQLSGFIRNGEITREEAVELALRIDGNCAPRYIHKFCDFIGISEDEFWERANKLRNPDVWVGEGNSWNLKRPLS